MSTKVFVVHPDAAALQSSVSALRAHGFDVESSDHLSLLSARHFDDAPPDLALIAASAADSVDTLLDWARRSVPRDTRLMLIVEKSLQRQLQTSLGYQIDEYLLSPVDPDEVLTRVRATLTRPPVAGREHLIIGPIAYDVAAHCVTVSGVELNLAPAEFRLMTFLLRHPGRVFNRRELLRHAWGEQVKAGERTVDVHIRRLRQILEQFRCDDMISTVRGFGYRLSEAEPLPSHVRNQKNALIVGANGERR